MAGRGAWWFTGGAEAQLLTSKLTAEPGAYAVTGNTANLLRHPVTVLSLSATPGRVPHFTRVQTSAAADAGNYGVAGGAATLLRHPRTVLSLNGLPGARAHFIPKPQGAQQVAAPGVYALTGLAASLLAYPITQLSTTGTPGKPYTNLSKIRHIVFQADGGTYGVTGSDISAAESGVYILSGSAASLFKQRRLAADPTSYDLEGADADVVFEGGHGVGSLTQYGPDFEPIRRYTFFRRALVLDASAGSYALTGTPVPFRSPIRYAVLPGAYQLLGVVAQLIESAEGASYLLTGSPVDLRLGPHLTADATSYALAGQDVVFVHERLAAEAGSYALTGNAALFPSPIRYAVLSGTYQITGSVVRFIEGVGSGSYLITGSPLDFRLGGARLTAEAGSYALAGQDVDFVQRRLAAEPGAYLLTGIPILPGGIVLPPLPLFVIRGPQRARREPVGIGVKLREPRDITGQGIVKVWLRIAIDADGRVVNPIAGETLATVQSVMALGGTATVDNTVPIEDRELLRLIEEFELYLEDEQRPILRSHVTKR